MPEYEHISVESGNDSLLTALAAGIGMDKTALISQFEQYAKHKNFSPDEILFTPLSPSPSGNPIAPTLLDFFESLKIYPQVHYFDEIDTYTKPTAVTAGAGKIVHVMWRQDHVDLLLPRRELGYETAKLLPDHFVRSV
jgi:hypothetical protein